MPDPEGAVAATVLIDVSSYAHAIGHLRGTRRARLHLASVLEVLDELGLHPQRLAVSLALIPVTTGPQGSLAAARDIVARNQEWFDDESASCTIPVVALPGAHDGVREIGVDDMVVAAALVEAARIRHDPDRASELLVVMSHDGDMDHLAGLAAPVPLVLAGSYDAAADRRMRRSGTPSLQLTDDQLDRCGSPPSSFSRERGAGAATRPSIPLPVSPVPAPALPVRPTAAVVDAYGLACSAASALGLARLPSLGSIESSLRAHGEPGDEASLLVTVPDVIVGRTPTTSLEQSRARAWRTRDRELDTLADELDHDGDPTTMVRRALLNTAGIPTHLADRLDRSGPVRAAKRLATQLTADLVRLVLEDAAEHVIVMTDSPHVVWSQIMLPELLGATGTGTRVTRWGVNAAPIVVHGDDDRAQLPEADFMVFTEQRLAELTRVGAHVGRSARQRLDRLARDPDPERSSWRVVGFDPEIDGLRLRNLADPQFEVLLADGLVLGLDIGEQLSEFAEGIELRFEPSAPASMPVLGVPSGDHGMRADSYRSAQIVGRVGSQVTFDLDGDGTGDVRIEAGHDLRPVRRDAPAVLGRLTPDPRQACSWVFVSVTDDSPRRQPTLVEVVGIGNTYPVVQPVAPAAEDPGPLFPPPHAPPVDVATGDRLWTVNTAGVGQPPTWVALSSPIRPRVNTELAEEF
jgi:hypothetical protein